MSESEFEERISKIQEDSRYQTAEKSLRALQEKHQKIADELVQFQVLSGRQAEKRARKLSTRNIDEELAEKSALIDNLTSRLSELQKDFDQKKHLFKAASPE
jgi:hypothetical protein